MHGRLSPGSHTQQGLGPADLTCELLTAFPDTKPDGQSSPGIGESTVKQIQLEAPQGLLGFFLKILQVKKYLLEERVFFQMNYSGLSLQLGRKGKVRSLLLMAAKALDVINSCLRRGADVPISLPVPSLPRHQLWQEPS